MILDDMPLHNITEKQIFFFIKLISAIIIFYIGLNYAVLPVGEDFSEMLQQNYVEAQVQEVQYQTGDIVNQYIQEGIQEVQGQLGIDVGGQLQTALTGQGHFAAPNADIKYKDKFTTICSSNTDLCDLISWVGDYTRQDKYLYVSSIFSVVNYIQKYKLVGDDLMSVLRTITIDNSVGDRRGYATWNQIVFNLGSVQSRSEFVGLSAHEMGHIYDLGALQGISSNKHGAFTEFGKKVFSTDDLSLQYYADSWKSEKIRKPSSSKKDFCSGYGMSDPFEDFAECFNLYVNHNTLFKTMAKGNEILKKKYNYVASIFGGKFLHANESEVSYLKENAGWRPWDTTRVSN